MCALILWRSAKELLMGKFHQFLTVICLWHDNDRVLSFHILFLAHLSSAQDELLWSLFVRRPSVCVSVRWHFQTTSLKPLNPILLKFHMESLRVGERKIAKMVAVRWPRWPPRPYMVKTFKNLLLQNRECLGAEPLLRRSTKIAKRIVVRWCLTFLRQGQVCFPMHLYGKNL